MSRNKPEGLWIRKTIRYKEGQALHLRDFPMHGRRIACLLNHGKRFFPWRGIAKLAHVSSDVPFHFRPGHHVGDVRFDLFGADGQRAARLRRARLRHFA